MHTTKTWLRLTFPTLTLPMLALISCYSPTYSSKPCKDNNGCPAAFFCDTSRSSTGVVGYCTEGARPVTDMAVDAGNGLPVLPEVEVAGGSFTIGSETAGMVGMPRLPESPAHIRTVARYFMDEKEVTVAAYRACVTAGKCLRPHTQADSQGMTDTDKCNYDLAGYDNHPVNCVEYEFAKSFCNFMGRRLPTETEWEFAATGLTTSSGDKYPWGSAVDTSKACFNVNTMTCPVGAKVKTLGGFEVTASASGFYDLAGNVWEWTDSEPCTYVADGSGRTCSSGDRVVRGGSSFDSAPVILRSTVRFLNKTGNVPKTGWNQRTGFRCARTP